MNMHAGDEYSASGRNGCPWASMFSINLWLLDELSAP